MLPCFALFIIDSVSQRTFQKRTGEKFSVVRFWKVRWETLGKLFPKKNVLIKMFASSQAS